MNFRKAFLEAGETFWDNARVDTRRAGFLAAAAFAYRVSHELELLAGVHLPAPSRAVAIMSSPGDDLQSGRPLRSTEDEAPRELVRPPCSTCGKPCAFPFIHPATRTKHCSVECITSLTEGSRRAPPNPETLVGVP